MERVRLVGVFIGRGAAVCIFDRGRALSIVVHHYYPLGSENVGDHLVALAIRRAVTRHFGPTEFVYFPMNDRYKAGDRPIGLLGENLERTNAQADLVIVGGSNLLEPRKPRREGLFKPLTGRWSVFTDVESINQLKVPLMLLGMGNGSSFGKPLRGYHEPAITEIRLLHEKAFAHAVRDQTTADMLRTIGVKTLCTGCPTTFLTPDPVTPGEKGSPLAVSFPPIAILKRRFGGNFLHQTMNYLAWLQSSDIPAVVTLHDARDQEPASRLVPRGMEIFYSEDLEAMTDRLRRSRGMIGFRLHGALHALGLGRPIIPVGLDWRGLAFLKTFDLEDIAIRSLRLGQFKRLRLLTERLLGDDPAMLGQLNSAKSKFLGIYEEFLTGAARRFWSIRSPQPGVAKDQP